MAVPLMIGAGLAAAGAAGSLFGGKSTPKYDIGPLLDQINKSKARQTQIAGALPGQLAPLTAQYQAATDAAIGGYQTAAQKSSADFLSSLGKNQDLQGKQLSDVLAQRVLGSMPQQQAQLREGLAATGGLERGAANTAMENLSTEAMAQIGQGEEAIQAQQLQAQQQALTQVYQMDENTILNATGMTKDEITQLYSSGRQDLINEANQLLGIESETTQQAVDVMGTGESAQLAADLAAQKQQQSFYNSLLGAGGTMMGKGA